MALPLAALLLPAACSDNPTEDSAPGSAVSRDLDSLARETGALPNSAQISPAGAYVRRYEGGGDRLCLVPEDDGKRRFRFGAETRFGGDEYCLGRGKARLAGSKLLLDFDMSMGSQPCTIVAEYEGDRIILPGSIDIACAALCSDRGSFAGVSFPRATREVAPESLKDRNSAALCR